MAKYIAWEGREKGEEREGMSEEVEGIQPTARAAVMVLGKADASSDEVSRTPHFKFVSPPILLGVVQTVFPDTETGCNVARLCAYKGWLPSACFIQTANSRHLPVCRFTRASSRSK